VYSYGIVDIVNSRARHTLQVIDGDPPKHPLIFTADNICICILKSAADRGNHSRVTAGDPAVLGTQMYGVSWPCTSMVAVTEHAHYHIKTFGNYLSFEMRLMASRARESIT